MALAFFLLIQHTRSLDFETVFARAPGLASNHWLVNLVALGLLGGAVAKSAQLPLQTWLPDAMEGPTPVIALVQTDIKRVIAYSTMSQIGYMFLGAGLGAYANGMFHLMTHAFFKALLFMAAGIVIHALAGEQDMRLMVGLGIAGIGVAWWIYSARRVPAPRIAWAQALFEHKFYFDELYDAVFYRPAVLLARGFLALVERPLVFGSISGLAAGVRELGTGTRQLQTGLVRSYALAIAASLAVVTVVFVVVR